MFWRKLELSPVIVINGGGYGTLEELLEVITWAQLGIHDKPEYSPCHESVASKLCWEIERIGYSSED
ncbi:hypothetical protein F2Q69_00061778 [Brassica cretica]|uniref:cytokinin riboside 5'-monophosphate phosphoribohydrolase n=1 Tax=Brassica cretica TaxID=69181 RepID=A0A8S9RGY3_BRACR|nr:hypothetical protein F2Q69_00061778 [Brassica cretica]